MEFVINRPSREQLAKAGVGLLLMLMFDFIGFLGAIVFYFTPLRLLLRNLPQRDAEPEQPSPITFKPALMPAYEAIQLIDKAMVCRDNCGICSNPGHTNNICNYLLSARALIPHGLTDIFRVWMEELVTNTMATKENTFTLKRMERVVHPMNRVVWGILVGVITLGFFVIQLYLGAWIG